MTEFPVAFWSKLPAVSVSLRFNSDAGLNLLHEFLGVSYDRSCSCQLVRFRRAFEDLEDLFPTVLLVPFASGRFFQDPFLE